MYKFTYRREIGYGIVYIRAKDLEEALRLYRENYTEEIFMVENKVVEFIN